MEGLAPPLRLLLAVREGIERGASIRTCLMEFVERDRSLLSRFLSRWLVERELGRRLSPDERLSPSERHLLYILERGLEGEPVLPAVIELEAETIERCEFQIEEFIEALPLKSLIPLLLFIFPAYLILLLGPLVEALARGLV